MSTTMKIKKKKEKDLLVHVGSRLHLSPKDIIYIRASDNYSNLKLVNGENYIVSSTLKLLEERLTAHGFIRISRFMLINPNYAKIDPIGSVAFVDGTFSYFSRRKRLSKAQLRSL